MERVHKAGNELINEIKNTNLPESFVAVWCMGQSSFLVKHKDIYVLFDPNLGDSLSKRQVNPVPRNFPSPLAAEVLDFIDYVFISHNHADHLEADTIEKINKCNEKVKFIIPAPVTGVLRDMGIESKKIVPAHSKTEMEVKGISFNAIPAAHYDIKLDKNGDADMVSYVVKLGELGIYHAGDTIVYPGMIGELKKYPINIAMVPINGRDYAREGKGLIGNTNFREAADLCRDIDADLLIPMHYDLYNHNTENPAFLIDYLYKTHSGRKYHLFQPGERFIYST